MIFGRTIPLSSGRFSHICNNVKVFCKQTDLNFIPMVLVFFACLFSVYVERIELRGVTHKSDKPTEYILEVSFVSVSSTDVKTVENLIKFDSIVVSYF